MKKINNSVTSKKELIEELKELFITARRAQFIYKKNQFSISELKQKETEYETFSSETKNISEKMFDYSTEKGNLDNYIRQTKKILAEFLENENEENQIKKLEIIMEQIILSEFEEAKDEKEKKYIDSIKYIKNRYIEILEKLGRIKSEKYDEQKIITLYKESPELKIHIDNDVEEGYQYGDFSQVGENTNFIIYKDNNVLLERTANYQARKSENKKIVEITEKLLLEEISKYQFTLKDENDVTSSITFFAETKIGDSILRGSKKTFKLMLAAACEAKMQGRQFIGRISCIDRDLETYITTYDDKLEGAIQKLLSKEKENLQEKGQEQIKKPQQPIGKE